MMITTNDIETISEYVIIQMTRRKLALTESRRQSLIALALRLRREQGLEVMQAQVEWELTLIADEERRPKMVEVMKGRSMRLGVMAQIQKYLGKLGSELLQDKLGFYCCIPRALASTDVSKELKKILRMCGGFS